MKQLSEIKTFGGIDADVDELLQQCFENHEAYLDVVEFRRSFVIGRKGSGKTAIYKRILNINQSEIFAFGHTFRDYPWHHHDKQKKIGVPEHECYSHSWKYLILITLSKILLNIDSSQPCSEFAGSSLAAIEAFVFDTYGTRDPDVSHVFQPNAKIKLSGSVGFKAMGASATIQAQSVNMTDLPSLVQNSTPIFSIKLLEA